MSIKSKNKRKEEINNFYMVFEHKCVLAVCV